MGSDLFRFAMCHGSPALDELEKQQRIGDLVGDAYADCDSTTIEDVDLDSEDCVDGFIHFVRKQFADVIRSGVVEDVAEVAPLTLVSI